MALWIFIFSFYLEKHFRVIEKDSKHGTATRPEAPLRGFWSYLKDLRALFLLKESGSLEARSDRVIDQLWLTSSSWRRGIRNHLEIIMINFDFLPWWYLSVYTVLESWIMFDNFLRWFSIFLTVWSDFLQSKTLYASGNLAALSPRAGLKTVC